MSETYVMHCHIYDVESLNILLKSCKCQN